MAVLRVESVVRGYHRYKDVWLPQIGDSFDLTIEEDNRHDRYAVATIVNKEIVGRFFGGLPTSLFSTGMELNRFKKSRCWQTTEKH